MTQVRPEPLADEAIALGVVGPGEHGIPRLAQQIASAATDSGFVGTVLTEPDPDALESLTGRLPAGVRLLHLHVNDWLFAMEHNPAGPRLAALATRLADQGVGLSLTLHDLPQASDGRELNKRRTGDYRSMVGSSIGAVVSSEHERKLLVGALAGRGASVTGDSSIQVIPLPIDRAPESDGQPPAPHPRSPTVGIFGYLYPGKGHREVLEELAGMEAAVTVLALGRPSERHADLLTELEMLAVNNGIDFRCTGYLADAEVSGQLQQVTIPVAPNNKVSASGSINSWLAAGRRPLVPAGRYVEELNCRMPGAVWIYQPGELQSSVQLALNEPDLTMIPADLVIGPSTKEVAERYVAWLRALVPE